MEPDQKFGLIVDRTDELLSAIRGLKSRGDDLSESEVERLVLLKASLNELLPPERFIWREAKPIVDIFRCIAKGVKPSKTNKGKDVLNECIQ